MSNIGVSKAPGSLRETLDFLRGVNQLLVFNTEVDTDLEIAGIEKALDNGPALLFENVKGFPGCRVVGNLLARMDTVAAMFGVSDFRKLKFKCLEAIKSPLPPTVVEGAPCQEVVVTRDIDVPGMLPLLRHTKDDAGRILGGGVVLFAESSLGGTSDITFRRIRFRGKDYASIMLNPVSHLTRIMRARKGDKIPITVNIGVSPAVLLVAGAWALHTVVPDGSDEVGIAGALQGFPVKLCRARTVEAYAIADSEWVLEGYIMPGERIWECEEAEKIGKPGVVPLFPEWSGYLSRALVTPKFQVTAVTHRNDRPIFYAPLAASFEADNMSKVLREACFFEFAQRFASGLVVDCNIPYGIKVNTGVVYKVKKRGSGDDLLLKNLLAAVLNVSMARFVMAVDEDINIYNADDLWWAVVTRMNTRTGVIRAPVGSVSTGYMVRGVDGGEGIALDATVPFEARQTLVRAHYPSDSVDLSRHLLGSDIARIRAGQSEWARWLAEIGG